MRVSLTDVKAVNPEDRPEDPYTKFFARKISVLLTWLFVRTPITPNGVSFLSIFVGLCAALFFSFPQYVYAVIGVILVHVWHILDCSDGELARLKNMKTARGAFLELQSTNIVCPAMFFGLAVGEYQRSQNIYVLVAGLILGYLYVVKNNIPHRHYSILMRKIHSKLRKGKDVTVMAKGAKDFVPNESGSWMRNVYNFVNYNVITFPVLAVYLTIFVLAGWTIWFLYALFLLYLFVVPAVFFGIYVYLEGVVESVKMK